MEGYRQGYTAGLVGPVAVAPSSPKFTGFKGCGSTQQVALQIQETSPGKTLYDEHSEGASNLIVVLGENLDKAELSKFSSSAPEAEIMSFMLDGNYYFLEINVDEGFTDQIVVSYDGTTIFTC